MVSPRGTGSQPVFCSWTLGPGTEKVMLHGLLRPLEIVWVAERQR